MLYRLIWDIDECLAKYNEMYLCCMKRRGLVDMRTTVEDIDCWDGYKKICPMITEEMLEEIGLEARPQLFPEVKLCEAFNTCAISTNIENHIVTSRHRGDYVADTYNWLEKYCLRPWNLRFEQDKGAVAKALGADLALDDAVHNCNALAEHCTVFMVARPHNNVPENEIHPRVHRLTVDKIASIIKRLANGKGARPSPGVAPLAPGLFRD